MNVNHPGLGAYDAVERQMHRDAIGDFDDFPAHHTVKSAEKARAGVISGRVLSVLILSTTLAIIGVCAVMATVV